MYTIPDSWLAAAIVVVFFMYIPLNRQRGTWHFEHRFDKHIPLVPAFAIPYFAYFPFIFFGSVAMYHTPLQYAFLESFLLASSICVAVWAFMPNGVRRPVIRPDSPLKRLLAYVYENDRDSNGLPSGHVVHTSVVGYYLAAAYPMFAIPIAIAVAAIDASTVLTKQHYWLDIVAGLCVVAFSIGFGT